MHKKKITPTGALLYVFLTVVLVFMMIPFVWLLISSLRPNADLFNEPFAVPKTLSFENFRAVMESHPMLLYFANSVAIATIATVIAVGAATLAAYAMQQRFLTRKSLTVLFSMCLFIPTNAFMVPYYVMINKIGLYDNVLGIALVYEMCIRDSYESVWQEPYFYSCNSTVMVHIRKLRVKIEDDPKNPKYIKTVWGKGYKFDTDSK